MQTKESQFFRLQTIKVICLRAERKTLFNDKVTLVPHLKVQKKMFIYLNYQENDFLESFLLMLKV